MTNIEQRTVDLKKTRKKHIRSTPVLPTLPIYIRVNDLIDMGVVANWMGISRLIKDRGFPAGRLLSPKTRIWTTEEVKAWLDARPTKIERCRTKKSEKSELAEAV